MIKSHSTTSQSCLKSDQRFILFASFYFLQIARRARGGRRAFFFNEVNADWAGFKAGKDDR